MKKLHLFIFTIFTPILINCLSLKDYAGAGPAAAVFGTIGYYNQKLYCDNRRGMVFKDGICYKKPPQTVNKIDEVDEELDKTAKTQQNLSTDTIAISNLYGDQAEPLRIIGNNLTTDKLQFKFPSEYDINPSLNQLTQPTNLLVSNKQQNNLFENIQKPQMQPPAALQGTEDINSNTINTTNNVSGRQLLALGSSPATHAPQQFQPAEQFDGSGLIGNYFKNNKIATIHDPSQENQHSYVFENVQEGDVKVPQELTLIGTYFQNPPCNGMMCAMVMREVRLYGTLKIDK